MLRILLSRIRGTFRRQRLDEEFDDEVREHLAMLEERFIRAGMDPVEASYAARRQFGGLTQVKEHQRERRALPLAGVLMRDPPARVPAASAIHPLHGVGRGDAGAGDWRRHRRLRRARCGRARAASVRGARPADGVPVARPARCAASNAAVLSRLLRLPGTEPRLRPPSRIPDPDTFTPSFRHSARSALIGSTRVAHRAGT